ncbi:MAG: beta-aspartyl-peptidase [Robiginitomaculum sp.]|nr:MAG: beta-aspartyl-peptidase [Robiginitomaculum sp.]PHQ67532.1 MAG: beta-aspartyl-peptidase [Robiginitomaculum sp.]
MKYFLSLFIWSCIVTLTSCASLPSLPSSINSQIKPQYALVIHGGAGTIRKKNIAPEKEAAYKAKLTQALKAGQSILEQGGSALDAVEASITIMEDSPLFNAGKGAVFTHEYTIEMDAAIMDGRTLNAGAVAGITHIKNPISLAREVMDNSEYVLLAGTGAEEFAKMRSISLIDSAYFKTDRRLKQLERAIERNGGVILDHDGDNKEYSGEPIDPDYKFGTVGAVAMDQYGNIAAGTSTGGLTNKRWNRIGDSPIIGAGTYADNKSCGVSATGHGEYFIRATVARSICAMVEYKGISLKEAAHEIINKKLGKMGGRGGIVAIDKNGNISMTFNTQGMYRGYVKGKNEPTVFIYK